MTPEPQAAGRASARAQERPQMAAVLISWMPASSCDRGHKDRQRFQLVVSADEQSAASPDRAIRDAESSGHAVEGAVGPW